MQWETSRHAENEVTCVDCHGADDGDVDAWAHEGETISVLVTPKDCSQCHEREYLEFSSSHHAKGGEILASLDNVLAEKTAGLPDNIADAVNGCWQCHGSIIRFATGDGGKLLEGAADNPGQPGGTRPEPFGHDRSAGGR